MVKSKEFSHASKQNFNEKHSEKEKLSFDLIKIYTG